MIFEKPISPFTLEMNAVKMYVQEMDLPGYTAFRIEFSSRRKPIVIARMDNFKGEKVWTSIPEGRQKEAEGIGPLIADYILKHQ